MMASEGLSDEQPRDVKSEELLPREESGWFESWFSWCPTSDKLLEAAERRILRCVQTFYSSKFVPIDGNHKIWTVVFNPKGPKIPLVMVHGFGGGLALWALNIDSLAQHRSLYTFDLLGFGRSSRADFSAEPEEAEEEFVDSIEKWREKLGLEKFVLLGHSLGGYLASSYALKYPSRVEHLMLVDPWGFPEKSPDTGSMVQIPVWVKLLGAVLSPFNPLSGLRAAGPFGPSLVQRFRPDFKRKFSSILSDDTIFNYIYHCNAQVPSGETAFKSMTIPYGWAKFPMIHRIGDIRPNIPITMVYGARSWIDPNSAHAVKQLRPESQVDIHIIKGAGHHVYADKPEEFNVLVEKICHVSDGGA